MMTRRQAAKNGASSRAPECAGAGGGFTRGKRHRNKQSHGDDRQNVLLHELGRILFRISSDGNLTPRIQAKSQKLSRHAPTFFDLAEPVLLIEDPKPVGSHSPQK